MISPITIATRGRIATTTKRTLTLATIGWLIGLGLTHPHKPVFPRDRGEVRHGGGGFYQESSESTLYIDRIRIDDDELILLIHSFLRTQ